jgi:Ser/Thr protein kinase RdoA (MazF antagonist)
MSTDQLNHADFAALLQAIDAEEPIARETKPHPAQAQVQQRMLRFGKYFRRLNLVHQDIKTDNVLLVDFSAGPHPNDDADFPVAPLVN